MAPRAREKASKRESEKGKLAGGDEHDDDEEAPDDPETSNLQSRKKRLRSLLTLFEQNQLVDLLVQIGAKIPAAADEIRDAVNADPRKRKLYVGSLNPNTTTETLSAAFSSFGEIEGGFVILDRETGKSRCYGFITFKNLEAAEEALENPPEKVDGYVIECDRAFDRWIRPSKKLYVGGLPLDLSTEAFRSHFSKYGEIVEAEVIYDRKTNTPKGYGFVTFKTVEGARQAIIEPKKFIGENRIFVFYADSKSKEPKMPHIMQSESTRPLPSWPSWPSSPPPPPPSYTACPYYGPYAIAGPHYYGGNEAYGMPPWGRSGYPYH